MLPANLRTVLVASQPALTHRPLSSRHLNRHSAEQYRRKVGTRSDVVSSEGVLAIHKQLSTVVAVIVHQLRQEHPIHTEIF